MNLIQHAEEWCLNIIEGHTIWNQFDVDYISWDDRTLAICGIGVADILSWLFHLIYIEV